MTEPSPRARLPVLSAPNAHASKESAPRAVGAFPTLSVFDMYTIGIGPSSSHTVGPMRAARRFVKELAALGTSSEVTRLKAELFGSLGHTGRGHKTDVAVLMGLEGEEPETVDAATIADRVAEIEKNGSLRLEGVGMVRFEPSEDLVFHKRKTLDGHPNALTLSAFSAQSALLLEHTYFSVGGGFIVEASASSSPTEGARTPVPYPFTNGKELLEQCQTHGVSVGTLARQNEQTWRPDTQVTAELLRIWEAMKACVERGMQTEGILPGGLKVARRAPRMLRRLQQGQSSDPLIVMDWVNLFALAVSEENAAGGRVVTAPTNGAAGIIPAVLTYYWRFTPNPNEDSVVRFLLAAGAIGMIYKLRASISGAEVGCQGEVGVACSMAAAGLAEALGGSPSQVEEAAEIGMEHNLGLTCDPVGGLVQVPCIERNAMGAIKAINAARLALQNDGQHKISLDRVIATMARTGADMNTKYKETARGGLAVNVPEC